jgi:peptidoglycan/xylan/chitin deacetylase (PgdA/CDA1 family)
VLIALVLPTLVASGGSSSHALSLPPATPAPATPLVRRGGDNQRHRHPEPTVPASVSLLTADDLAAAQPNELGRIPILEYHAFTTDPAQEAEFVRTVDDFRADLTWLADHDFVVVPVRDVVRHDLHVPAGKHPVVLTFDDALASQFLATVSASGELVPDPDSAVGILEAFFVDHPEVGRGGVFAVVPAQCFAVPDHEEQWSLCDQKLAWLIAHGYEVVNHTMDHVNLRDVDDATFQSQVGEAVRWLDAHAPGHEGQYLVLPNGRYPDRDRHPAQRRMLEEGFAYGDQWVQIEAAFMVGSDPAPSPASALWEPLYIPRVQAYDAWLDRWFAAIEAGAIVLYTSDGNPDTVTVPDPLPAFLDGELDPARIAAQGLVLRRYDPATFEVVP